MNNQVKQIRMIRSLCKLLVEQQEGVLGLISDMLDEFEAEALNMGNTCENSQEPAENKENEEGAVNGK